MILALRATAMPTGAGPPFGVIAFGAVHKELSGLRCSALPDCFDGAQVAGQNS